MENPIYARQFAHMLLTTAQELRTLINQLFSQFGLPLGGHPGSQKRETVTPLYNYSY